VLGIDPYPDPEKMMRIRLDPDPDPQHWSPVYNKGSVSFTSKKEINGKASSDP
jgi:hypothetical protein